MIRRIVYVVAAMLGTASINSGFAQSRVFPIPQPPKYPLMCRGALNYAVGTGQDTTVVFFARNPSHAGTAGISLRPGSCAWKDRPVNQSEPTRIFVKPETSSKVHAAFIAFTACAGDSNCVVEFLAFNSNDASNPHFWAENSYIRIYHPHFQ